MRWEEEGGRCYQEHLSHHLLATLTSLHTWWHMLAELVELDSASQGMRVKIVKTLLIQVKSNNDSFVAMGLSCIQMSTKGHFLLRPIGANLSNLT